MASSTNQHNWIRWFPCSHDLQRVPPFQVISLSSLFTFFFRFQKTLRHVEFALNPKMVCLFCISHDFGLDMKVFSVSFSMVFEVAFMGAKKICPVLLVVRWQVFFQARPLALAWPTLLHQRQGKTWLIDCNFLGRRDC